MFRILGRNFSNALKRFELVAHDFQTSARMPSFTLPTTMKIVHQLDPNSISLTMEEAPLPKPSHPEDCLIQVYTTSPCVGELHWQVWFPSIVPAGSPRVPGTEAAGVVVQIPEGGAAQASGFKVGDRVFFRVDPEQTGHLRQYSLARLSQMAHVPSNMGWIEAGSTALSSLTAWQGVFQHGILDSRAILGDAEARKTNQKLSILITGASGVVGGWAVHLAALAGAGRIVALCDSLNTPYVKELGATEAIDYKKESVAEWVAKDQATREVDFAFDCVGGATLGTCWSAVREGGSLLSITGDPGKEKPYSSTKTLANAKWMLVAPNGKDLQSISDLIAKERKCVTKVDSVLDFADFQQAFDKVEARKANGKVVIKVADI
jgi:NADPH:quinone reductase-like Zn-dependent oxidoreductase